MELTTLSWMLLIADITKGWTGLFVVFATLTLVCLIVRAGFVATEQCEKSGAFHHFRICPSWAVMLFLMFAVPALLTALVPSKTAIIQIAAIELGDDIISSPEFQRLLDTHFPKSEP